MDRITEQEQRNASLRQHIADLEASGAVVEHVIIEGVNASSPAAVANCGAGFVTFTGWEGQS